MVSQGLRCHDYAFLLSRWKRVCKSAGLTIQQFAEADGYPIYVVCSKNLGKSDIQYISAGIHGDEPASTEGLITWAEANIDSLRSISAMIFPCLNPWGLVNNIRCTASGLDLNRIFHQPRRSPMITGWLKLVAGYHFKYSLHLHEDYDGQGCYIYELRRATPPWGTEILESVRVATGIPPDMRKRIEGRHSNSGIIWRRFTAKMVPFMPEALYLSERKMTRRLFTFETPSEWGIESRVQAQVTAIETVMRLSASEERA